MLDFLQTSGTHLPLWEIVLRLTLAALFTLPLGLYREVRQRNAGLRTHMLVGLAAATFTVGAWEILHIEDISPNEGVRLDPIRVIEAITAGVAFLAAGAIIQSRGEVKGLTTGAGLWMAGAIGLITGLGLYAFALVATVISLIIVVVLRWMESLGRSGEE